MANLNRAGLTRADITRMGRTGVAALAALLGAAGSCSAAGYAVLNTASSGAGSLAAALAAASADSDSADTITFDPTVTGTIPTGGAELAIGKSVTIAGPGADVLAIDAGGSGRVFDITSASATVAISGLTLANGNVSGVGSGYGGGIYSQGALTVTACAFTGDGADFGGGLYNDGGTVSVAGCTFSGDTAGSYGGGLFNGGGTAVVTDSTFSGDAAGVSGGALGNLDTVAVAGVTFSGDAAGTAGGAVANYGTLTVTASLFAGSAGGDSDPSGTPAASGGSNLLGDADGNGFVGGTNYDQTGVANALLGPLAANGGPTQTCAVFAGSPAIGGDHSGATAADQRGTARASRTIGSFEYVAPAPVVPPAPAVRTHLLWDNTDGRAMLWNVDAAGGVTLSGFGPYTDGAPQNKWVATALATGPDGMNHVLWNNTDGRVMLWTVDNAGNFTLAGYGPYTDDSVGNDPTVNKWHAVGVSVGPDNVTHLLWDNTDGRVMLWDVDPAFSFTVAGYGPYTDDSVGGDPTVNKWVAAAVATGPDNVTRLLWDNTDGRVMLWNVAPDFTFTLAGYGPYTDNAPQNKWYAAGVSVGADNTTHLLWDNTDSRVMLWDVDSSYGFTLAGFGPYTDDSVGGDPSVNKWYAAALATGPDNVTRLAWDNTDSRVMLWDVDPAFSFTVAGHGPYTDDSVGGDPSANKWYAVGVSAAP